MMRAQVLMFTAQMAFIAVAVLVLSVPALVAVAACGVLTLLVGLLGPRVRSRVRRRRGDWPRARVL